MFCKFLVLACFIGMPCITLSMNQEKRKLERDLFIASGKGQLATVQALVQQGVCVNSNQKDARTPLMVAALNNHRMVVAELLKSKAQPQAQDRLGFTYKEYGLFGCVAAAAAQEDSKRKFDEEGARAWIEECAHPRVLNVYLFDQIEEKELHEHSSTKTNVSEYPILELSLYSNWGNTTRWVIPLLRLGADPNVWQDRAPLSLAMQCEGSQQEINALIGHGARINDRSGMQQMHTAFMYGILANKFANVACLLQHSDDIKFDALDMCWCVGRRGNIKIFRDVCMPQKKRKYVKMLGDALHSALACHIPLIAEYLAHENRIFDAILELDYEDVQKIIAEDPGSVHAISSFTGMPPLGFSIVCWSNCLSLDHKNIAARIGFLLLESGANPNGTMPDGKTLAECADHYNMLGMCDKLKEAQRLLAPQKSCAIL